jgi:hypothetical protein
MITKLIQYTAEEADNYNAATGILDLVIGECCSLFNNTTDEDEKAAILEFEKTFAIWRTSLMIADKESVDRVYKEARPLLFENKLTLDYIMKHTTTYAEAI